MIHDYQSFIAALLEAGFSGAVGGKDDGVFSLFRYGWGANETVVWHSGDPNFDPWEWRMRVLEERNDIAYSKVFFKKAGYITKEWYPYFLAARRGNSPFYEEYSDGKLSALSKRIYEVFEEKQALPFHEIKVLAKIRREDGAKFESALNELQMKLYLTMCGREQRLSLTGEGYGWYSTVFRTTESFWQHEVFEQAESIPQNEAIEVITRRISELNPNANQKKIKKFITG